MTNEEAARLAIGKALRAARRRRGFAQEKLALEGFNRSHLSDIECGRTSPKVYTLLQLCEVLEIEFSALAREIERNYQRLRGGNRS